MCPSVGQGWTGHWRNPTPDLYPTSFQKAIHLAIFILPTAEDALTPSPPPSPLEASFYPAQSLGPFFLSPGPPRFQLTFLVRLGICSLGKMGEGVVEAAERGREEGGISVIELLRG